VSIQVELDAIAQAVAHQMPLAYLLTVSDDERVHVVAVVPDVGADIVCSPGNRARTNIASRSTVTLVWPPVDPVEKSLLVDGDARVDGDVVIVTPRSAILHVTR